MAINFTKAREALELVVVSNKARDAFVADLVERAPKSRGQLAAWILEATGLTSFPDAEWEDLDQDGRDIRTVWSQAVKALGL